MILRVLHFFHITAEDNSKKEMSKAEKDRAERNRLKALTLKRTRVLARPNTQVCTF